MNGAEDNSADPAGRLAVRHVCIWTACFTLVIPGCAGTRIPADWPSYEQSGVNGECASLAGQYSNIPADRAFREPSAFRTVGGKGAHDYRLSQVLGSLASVTPADHERIMYITIRPGDASRVIISGEHQDTGSVAISITLLPAGSDAGNPAGEQPGRFNCKDGFFHISRTGWAPITPVMAAGILNIAYIRLRKAVDGSLIVNAVRDMHGTLPLIPVPVTGSIEGYDTWYRFGPYIPQPGENVPAVN